ncbi:MAG: hypothetical protein K1X79_02960 [Oligoflexia bacterium]|nr:hypothetical protein [Oligoflexia bacterium]
MDAKTVEAVLGEIESVLDNVHQQQCRRAHVAAQRVRPELTTEDVLNPDNFPELIGNPDFMYEDGQAAGILAAKMAVRARLKELSSPSQSRTHKD